MMCIVLFILAGGILVLLGILLLLSPGKPEPFLDAGGRPLAGSISEKIRVPINGLEQGMFIVGRDVSNPVLLYLHGGMPEYFLSKKYPTGLEDSFTVVWWEQRGSGLSFRSDISPETMTAEQFISDTLEVTNYLRRRFGKDQIYLMGHSGGTFTGIQAAARAPELYHAYIGVAQISHQLESELLAYEYMVQQFRERGNEGMVRRLEAAPVTMADGVPRAYLALRDPGMHPLGIGTTHGMKSVFSGIFIPSWLCRDYTFGEKVNLWRGKFCSGASSLWDEIIATDLSQRAPELDIPVYFFEGVYDYTCSYKVAKSYVEVLRAPLKGFYTFEQSAHSPVFEEPTKALRILREDVLAGTNHLADAK